MDCGVWERMGEECAHRGVVAIKEVSEEKVPDALEMKSPSGSQEETALCQEPKGTPQGSAGRWPLCQSVVI